MQFFPLLLPLLLLPEVLFSSFQSMESIFVSKKSLLLVFISEVKKWLENSRDSNILRLIKKTEEHHKLIILTVLTVIV